MRKKVFLAAILLSLVALFLNSVYAATLRDKLRERLKQRRGQSSEVIQGETLVNEEKTFTGSLDWLSADDEFFYDSSGRRIILRGFITLTHNAAGQCQYTHQDYIRMKSWGTNCQSIRFHALLIGAWPGAKAFGEYFKRLDNMVALAKEAGIYTELKLTMYGIRGFDWTDIWLNKNGEQEAVINGWKNLWQRYKNEPAVVGYDLLNEPEKGKLNISDDEFVEKYLMPFYRKAIDEFQKIDNRHLIFFQPSVTFKPQYSVIACNTPIKKNRVVYAPHFYPDLRSYDTTKYASVMGRFVREANMHQAPLFIGEFGVYWDKRNDGDTSKENAYKPTEKVTAELFDKYLVGFSRPWFSDDKGQVKNMPKLNWALIKGTSGLSGSERKFIVDILVRPYPERIAGKLSSFRFDINTKKFSLTYQPTSGTTEIFIPQDRHYKNGFTIVHSAGLTLRYNPGELSELEVIKDSEDGKAGNISWDRDTAVLRINEWLAEKNVTIEVTP